MITPWVRRLIIINGAMLVVTALLPDIQSMLMFVPALAFVKPWTPFTYMFLHAGIGHLIFNMLTLFFFGPRLETELGGRNFLLLYGISGVTAAILSSLLAPQAAIVGASGAIYGVLIGFASLWPRAPIHIWGIVPIEARWLVAGWTLLSLAGGFGASSDGVAHFAHLGGFIGGFLYLRFIRANPGGTGAAYAAAPARRTPEVSDGDVARWKTIDAEALHAVNREEYRRIMEKMTAEGTESLTSTERDFLNRFAA